MAEVAEKPKVVLPTGIIKASHKSPKNLIIFSKEKTGKTALVAQLPDCLLIDTENGSDFVDAMKYKVASVDDILELGKAIKEAGYPYKYIAVDTTTQLEEICLPYAEKLYSGTSMGKNWFVPGTGGRAQYGGIKNLPNGAGYQYLREAYQKVTAFIEKLAPRVIYLGHVKDTVLEKNGAEFSSLELDLTGKLKRIAASNSDAIGYLYRKSNQNILSFRTTDEISCGARPDHLKNQEIVVSEMIEGVLHTYWDKIYID